MKVAIRNLNNQPVGEIELPEAVFGYEYKEHLIHLAVKSYLAGRRRGTAKTKVRGEVSGSGKKLWRQKGTGRARMGSLRSWSGARGRPRPPASRLSDGLSAGEEERPRPRKLADERLVVLDRLVPESPKTRTAAVIRARRGQGASRPLGQREPAASRNNPALKASESMSTTSWTVLFVVSEPALRLMEVLAS